MKGGIPLVGTDGTGGIFDKIPGAWTRFERTTSESLAERSGSFSRRRGVPGEARKKKGSSAFKRREGRFGFPFAPPRKLGELGFNCPETGPDYAESFPLRSRPSVSAKAPSFVGVYGGQDAGRDDGQGGITAFPAVAIRIRPAIAGIKIILSKSEPTGARKTLPGGRKPRVAAPAASFPARRASPRFDF